MKLSDAAVKNPDSLKWNNLNKRYAPTNQSKTADPDDDEADDLVPENDQTAGSSTDSAGALRLPTKENPVIIAIYGQICIAAKSYQSAICQSQPYVNQFFGETNFHFPVYLLHAYDYYPEDPMICLCLAIASVGRAMQRQSDNRHHLVVQVGSYSQKMS